MPDRLLVDLGGDGWAKVSVWPEGGLAEEVSRQLLAWPLDGEALEDLRWYLEDYLRAPFGVWEERGPAVQGKLAGWGEQVFGSVFGSGPARDAYAGARERELEVLFRSDIPELLGLPWELMRDGTGPMALAAGGISRSLPVADSVETLEVPGGKLRVLMVIARPAATDDVGYQMVARPLLERLEAIRGEVELTVLRPPTFGALARALRDAAEAGAPFHVVHFDGHGAVLAGEGTLVFEEEGGSGQHVPASVVAKALGDAGVPVAVLNACHSGAVGKDLEAAVATALLRAGCAAVVAMAYSVYAVAAAEFMAAFYEALFAGASVGEAVTAGRWRLFDHDGRPSQRGDMPLADWLIPVHYLRAEVRFSDARTSRPAAARSLDEALDGIRAAPQEPAAADDALAAVGGVFVGRDDLFYELEATARLRRVVVLSGPGGTGKTEVAKGFARWWRDTGGVDDPRLVFWHSFEPGTATFGLDGVVTRIGLHVFGSGFARLDPIARLAAVKRLLSQYRGLLVWDNFESVAEMPDPAGATAPLDGADCVQLREFLHWVRDHSKSAVIITSRTREGWLGQVGRIYIGGLNWADATEYARLLLATFPAARRHQQRRSFGELLEWLDGHPLAMRLTLPRLQAVGPADLLAGLRTTAPLADGAAAEGRLSSLGACVTYSFAYLSEPARPLLPALSLFHGVADENVLTLFSAVEGVPGRFAGASREAWSAMLDDAARVGLLSVIGRGAMYRIHPALPGYLAAAWQAADPSGYQEEHEAAERALRAACAAFSEWLTGLFRSGDAGLAYSVVGWQRQTLGAMLGLALDHRAWDDAVRIVRALDGYWDTRGLVAEAGAWADRILAATAGPDNLPVETAESLWLYTFGEQARRQVTAGRPDKAAQAYQQILTWEQGQPATEWIRGNIAVTQNHLGATAQDCGRLDEAEDWYRKSLAIREELGDRRGMASSYHQLGRTAQARGRLDEAEDWYRKSLAITEELGDRPSMALGYHQLGRTADERGRLDEAEDWYREALAIKEELGDRAGVALTYHQLGMSAQARGRLDEAEDWYREALAIKEELGDRAGVALTYHQLGMSAQARGRLDEAEDWHREALAIEEELGDRTKVPHSYQQLGRAALERGRLDEAEEWCRMALAIEEELGDGPAMSVSYFLLGMTAQGRGSLDEAENWYRRSIAIAEKVGNRQILAASYGQLGLLAETRHQPRQALDEIIRCVTLLSESPSPLTEPGSWHLARLSRQLGLPVLEQAWQQITGQTVPQSILDYITSHHDSPSPEEP